VITDILSKAKAIARSGRRSSKWPALRLQHLKSSGECQVCGGKDKLEVHHIIPVHVDPSLELQPYNLITLCESGLRGVNCHLFFGHLGNYKKWNIEVRSMAKIFSGLLK
jgi:hypothetical protein